MTTTETRSMAGADALLSLPFLMTRKEVAQLARCSPRTVLAAERRGDIESVNPDRVGARRALYRSSDVRRWLGLTG